jgi:hypothetical protein
MKNQPGQLPALIDAMYRLARHAAHHVDRGSHLEACLIAASASLAAAAREIEREEAASESERRARTARQKFRVVQ